MSYKTPDNNFFKNEKSVFNKTEVKDSMEEHLWFQLFEDINLKLTYIERTNWYLSDNRLLENVFIIGSRLVYYYYENPYSPKLMGDISLIPKRSIKEEFNFSEKDILLITLNNTPKYSDNIPFFRRVFTNNILKQEENIKINDIVHIKKRWNTLPNKDGNDIYRNGVATIRPS